jgi:hypothetical protein
LEPKKGDRVSLDAKKVGQQRRGGVVQSVNQGISGVRYQIEWDDGSQSVIAPGAGILLVEGKTASSSSKKPKAASKSAKAAAGRPKAPKKGKKAKAGSKAKTGKLR